MAQLNTPKEPRVKGGCFPTEDYEGLESCYRLVCASPSRTVGFRTYLACRVKVA